MLDGLHTSSVLRTQAALKEAIASWTELFGFNSFRECASGTMLFQEGQLSHEVFFLVKGLVVLSHHGFVHSNEVRGIRVPGQLIDQGSYSLHLPHRYSAKTVVKATVARVPISELERERLHNPAIGLFFERSISLDLYKAADFIEQLQTYTPAERLERLLQDLASAMGGTEQCSYPARPLPLLEEEIACIIGLSPRQFKRVKKQMRDAGRLKAVTCKSRRLFFS